jgi:hypothetical protein
MKKILFTASLSLAGVLLFNACGDKFLTRVPQGAYSPSVLENAQGVEALLVGAYAQLDGIPVPGPGWYGAVSNWVFGGIPSDDAYKGTDAGDQPEETAIERYVWVTTNEHVRGKWGMLYNGVARANGVLQTLPKATDLSDARKKQIEGEARFLRGFFHFEAKKMWNKIPYIDDKTYNSGDPNSTKVPNTDDAWPKIEADFQAAINLLPDDFPGEPGRADKWAAIAMLAKCKMFQGFDVNTGAPNAAALTAAKTLLDQIIASKRFSLMARYGDNFSAAPANRNNNEAIFEVQYSLTSSADGGGNQGDGLAWPYNAGPGGCCGFYQPSQNLVNSFKTDANGLPLLDTFNDSDVKNDEGVASNDVTWFPETRTLDPRLDHTVGRRGIPYKDWTPGGAHPGKDWIRDQAYGGPFSPKKHIAEKAYSGVSGWQNLNANNYRYLRYDHVLLWAAECEVEVGSLAKALDYVNQVRRRAANPDGFVMGRLTKYDAQGLPVMDPTQPAANYLIKEYASFPTKDFARKAVRFEERLEFGMEGTRFFDLVRWGVASDVLNAYVAKERLRRTYLNGATFKKGTNEYYPIPQQEIINSTLNGKATLVQNPGY